MKIDFTVTSLCRPEVTARSLYSLNNSISGIYLSKQRVFLNIDPIPDCSRVSEVINIFKSYFGEVITNSPEEANFTKAIKWCWGLAESDLIFHYEDDWVFQPFYMNDMQSLLDEDVMQVNLRAYSYKYDKMCLSPSIIKKECYKSFSIGMIDTINPEVQLRNKKIFDFKPQMIKTYGKNIMVRDIGRIWAKQNNIKKPPRKGDFIGY